MNTEICNAIKNKNVIEFYYEGELRIIEPHCYGVTTKGRESIIAFQLNKNGSGNDSWKSYNVDKVDSLKVIKKTFEGVRSSYKSDNSEMDTVFSEL